MIFMFFSDLCGLGVPSTSLRTCFARDNPTFGCGCGCASAVRSRSEISPRQRIPRFSVCRVKASNKNRLSDDEIVRHDLKCNIKTCKVKPEG
jgi:hypothetical protein